MTSYKQINNTLLIYEQKDGKNNTIFFLKYSFRQFIQETKMYPASKKDLINQKTKITLTIFEQDKRNNFKIFEKYPF